MKVTTSKSKNSESFYIAKSFINDKGVSTSVNIRKLGTLKELIKEHGPTRDDVMAWARAEAKLETMKYKAENEAKKVKITFNTDAKIKYDRQAFHRGGYLFLQSMYYALHIDKICRKLKDKYKFEYDINSILSDMLYARILEPSSKRSSYNIANEFLEKPSYSLHDVYRALSVLGDECDFIQSEVYKNSHFLGSRNDKILYYDCTNYYFEISQEDGCKKHGKSKEHRPNPIVQMGMFMDGDGIPLAFSLFPGNSNEQTSVKPLEEKILSQFGCQKFIYCSDAGLGAERIREYNHMGKRAFIVTQSIKKLKAEERAWALNKCGFKNLYDDMSTDISNLPYDDKGIYYKEIPYTPRELHQRLIVVYSPKYARYQKTIRGKQIAVTNDGEIANIHDLLDNEKIENEALFDGLYAVSTDLLDDKVSDIIHVSEGRWEIEECFRIMKTDFEARPVFLQKEIRIKAHFLTCFLALILYRCIEQKMSKRYTCTEILGTIRNMNFATVQEQGYIPIYKRTAITDKLHQIFGFNTDFQFMTKQEMRNIQKKSKGR